MAKVNTLQTSWSGGELSPRLDGRPDLKKFSQGARVIENFLVMPHGGVKKRSGSKFVTYANGTGDLALIPFQYSTEQSYMIAFGDQYIWFFKDEGIITGSSLTITDATQNNPCVITSALHGLSNGDKVLIQSVAGMTELNNRWFTVANKTTNTFELSGVNSSAYTAYSGGGTAGKIIELATTYTAAQVQEIQVAQSADTLYIVHKDHPVRKLQRASHTSWTLSTPTIDTGPFRTVNANRDYKLVPAFDTATITDITQTNPAVVTASGHPFTNGQYVKITSVSGMTEVNDTTFIVANATGTTFELQSTDATGFTAYSSGGSATMAASAFGTYIVGQTCTLNATGGHTPFTSTMVGAIIRLSEEGASSGYQSASLGNNAIPIAAGDVYSNSGKVYGVSYATAALTWQPFNRVPSHDSGTVRVYNGSPTLGTYFDSAFLHPTYCVVKIISYSSSTSVRVQIMRYQMPKSIADSGTSFWEEGAWSDRRGYPRAVAFYEQRLWFAGGESDPTVVWSSQSGAYENFEDGTEDSNALVYRVPGRSADVIRWLHAGRVLTAGSSFGEFAFASSSQNQALTPSNVKASPQTSFGSSSCQPLPIGQAVLYPQRNGNADNPARKLREFQYRYDQDAFGSTDLTVFSEHVFGDGITRLAYQTEPDSLIWCRRTDGALACCTYERLQEVVAWHRHIIKNGSVKTLAVCPGADGDTLWLHVERTIAGQTVRYFEVLSPTFRDDDDKEDATLLDAHLSYEGSSTTTISGLWHLRSEAVTILNNGAVETGTVSSGGRLTLSRASAGGPVHIGYAYNGIVESEDFEAGAQAGTAQSRAKRVSQIYIRLLNSLGGTAGPDAANQKPLLYRRPSQPMGSSPPLYSGLMELDFPGGWDRFARVRVEHDDPLPCHITSMVVELNVNG